VTEGLPRYNEKMEVSDRLRDIEAKIEDLKTTIDDIVGLELLTKMISVNRAYGMHKNLFLIYHRLTPVATCFRRICGYCVQLLITLLAYAYPAHLA